MKEYTICKPNETKKRALFSPGHTSNFHCTKKGNAQIMFMQCLLLCLNSLDSIIENCTYIRKSLVQWKHLHPFCVWEWPRVNFSFQQLRNKLNYRQWFNESCCWHIWKVIESKMKIQEILCSINMGKKSSVMLKTSCVLASNGEKTMLKPCSNSLPRVWGFIFYQCWVTSPFE